jgi:hypothetical protein
MRDVSPVPEIGPLSADHGQAATTHARSLGEAFTADLLKAGREQSELLATLRRWAGVRLTIAAGDRGRAAEVAQRLVDAHVPRREAAAILAARCGLSHRHARRLVAVAVAARGQAVAASVGTMPSIATPRPTPCHPSPIPSSKPAGAFTPRSSAPPAS